MIPVFNDWVALRSITPLIDDAFSKRDYIVELLLIDDSSTETMEVFSKRLPQFRKIEKISCLQLGRNVGHQKAISIGLLYLSERKNYDAVGIMDADGQDQPVDMTRLVDDCIYRGNKKLIFARRKERTETTLFKVFYLLYITTFRISTGITIRYGHFSAIPKSILSKIVLLDNLSTSFVSSILCGGVPYTSINTTRGQRIKGQSKMMFGSLVMHGLSAFAVCKNIIQRRLRRFTLTLVALSLAGVAITGLVDFNLKGKIESGIYWTFPIVGVATILAISAFWLVVVLVERKFRARSVNHNQPLIKQIITIYQRST